MLLTCLFIPHLHYADNIDEARLWPAVRVTENTGRVHAGCASFEYLPSKAFENRKYIEGITTQNTYANAVRTIKDLLSLTPEIFNGITTGIIDSVKEDLSHTLLLDETLTTPISRDEIFDVVSKDGVSEAAIIKWIILESARQDGMSRKEINQLIQSIVLETKASNTPENVANIFATKEFKDFVSDKDKVNIVIIQTPFTQTRAGATLNKFLHKNASSDLQNKEFNVYNMSFDLSSLYYHYKNIPALTLSLGEWARLIAYSLKGDIIPIINSEEGLNSVPLEILVNVLSLLPVLIVALNFKQIMMKK